MGLRVMRGELGVGSIPSNNVGGEVRVRWPTRKHKGILLVRG
jgi:hypothetical protein